VFQARVENHFTGTGYVIQCETMYNHFLEEILCPLRNI
jgi:hypothetical protein